ncbi:MAG TPA: 3' terminal RNA ribose 2'-O-methyltransferase Hen1 [Solirubrobacterales bacterium]|nr:3' terminal RNA ribose 2'-O-methyltransferase Hen1 [Solirubrobacterales bacterium]
MLLTLSTAHRPATDLGFLLHKHPDRVQSFSLPFGTARVFYPGASEERCTVALMLDIDPVGLVRRGRGSGGFALAEYVNDRPYVASSFMSVALVSVFKSAMAGTCKGYEELASSPLPLEAWLPVVPARGGAGLARSLFEPLGYRVEASAPALDPRFPQWGPDRHVDLRLTGDVRLADLLTHLYVLLPVLDDDKHYWVDESEIDKLMRRGEGWLAGHPERELITRRYLKNQASLFHPALALLEDEVPSADEDGDPSADEAPALREQRLDAVLAALQGSGARRVLDLGCGSGALLRRLMADGYEKVVGIDVSIRALEGAARRLDLETMHDAERSRIELLQSPLTYRDRRLEGFDAAALVEVIEHLDPPRLGAMEENVFGSARPATVIVTTPNAEYNVRWSGLDGGLRHPDHRFEWTREEFASWSEAVSARHGYSVRRVPVGPEDPEVGAPTQMAVFTR